MGWTRALALAACLSVAPRVAADAHPHVFVDARTEVVFDGNGRITAVRNVWQFDETFSQFAVQGLDANGSGQLTREELKPLADVNMKSLAEFKFFTFLTVGRDAARFLPPKEYRLEFNGGR